MITYTIVGAEKAADLEKFLDEIKASLVQTLRDGRAVNLHLHHETKLAGVPPRHDFLYEGWTFGASVGEYPRKP